MPEKKDILILAIESSCDETAASVVKNGREILSNVISSQNSFPECGIVQLQKTKTISRRKCYVSFKYQ